MRQISVRRNRNIQRKTRGASLVESILGAIVLIPIALAAVDLMCIVFANSMNDTVAKNCARAGANQPNGGAALLAAQKVLSTSKKSGIVKSIELVDLDYQDGNARCTATTVMVMNLPVPFPGYSNITFTNKAAEPIVGTADPTKPDS